MTEKYENDYDDFTLREIDSEQLSGSLSPFTFICMTFILILMGLVMAYSASYDAAARLGLKHYHYLLEMIIYGALGTITGLLFFFSEESRLESLSIGLFPLSVVVMIIVFISRITGNQTSWNPNFPTFSISPLIEFSTVLFLSSVLPRAREKDRRGWLYLAIMAVFLLVLCTMIYLGCYSDAIIYGILLMILFTSGGIDGKYVFTVALFLGTFLVFRFLSSDVHMEVALSRMMPSMDGPKESQIAHDCMLAISEGGFTGKGIGNGYYKLGVIPGIHTDYIFANLAEETGILGTLIVFLFYMLYMLLGLRASSRASLIGDDFARMASLGFTFLIVFKVIMSMAVTSGLIPSDGIGMPFFSTNGPEHFLTMLESALLYKFIHMTGRGYERLG